MNSKYIFITSILFVILLSVCNASAEIQNGGFETGDTSEWDTSTSSETYVNLSVVDTRSASGTYSLRILASADYEITPWEFGYVSQHLEPADTTNVGLLYNIEFIGGGFAYLSWFDYAGDDATTYAMNRNTSDLWVYGELLSTQPEGDSEVVFQATAEAYELYPNSIVVGYYDNITEVSHDDIINPGFEDDWLWGWAIDANLSIPGVSQSSEQAHTGAYSLKVYLPDDSYVWESNSVEQPFMPEDVVMEYSKITFWYNVPSLDTTDIVEVRFVAGAGGGELGGSTATFEITSTTDGWVQGEIYTSELTEWDHWGHPELSEIGSLSIAVSNGGEVGVSDTIAYFDDFEFYCIDYEGESTPTPPSCAPITGPITGDTTSYESITFTGSCGECSSDYTYRFEFSGTPDGFTMATETLAIPAPSANETIEIYSPYFPYRTGETYYYRIVRDDGEVGATMTFAAGEVYPVATTTYTEEHYEPFVEAEWDIGALAGVVPVPYFARFGYLLWAIFWGAILMAFWVRQEDVTIPAFIYLIVFTVLNLADWLPSSFVAVSWVFAGICLGAILYTLFRGRKHG